MALFEVVLLLVFLRTPGGRGANIASTGLYAPEDPLQILTIENFNGLIYGKPHAWFVEFYNSWCGHCRRYAPEFKQFAAGVRGWSPAVRVGAIDCAADENTGLCRQYEVMAYPTLRFFHEEFVEGPKLMGEDVKGAITAGDTLEKLVRQMTAEQVLGRGKNWPALMFKDFNAAADAWTGLGLNVHAVILIFQPIASTIGGELAMDLMNLTDIRVWSVSDAAPLFKSLATIRLPGIYSVDKLTFNLDEVSSKANRDEIRADILQYLVRRGINVPSHMLIEPPEAPMPPPKRLSQNEGQFINFTAHRLIGNTVFQSDIEAGLRYTLVHEISSKKLITGDELLALQQYLQALVKHFPAKSNTKSFLVKLNDKVAENTISWTGEQFSQLVQNLEIEFTPVYSSTLQWIGCKGSEAKYRGFTCSLWTIFHVMTASEALNEPVGDSAVLNAMLGYVKFFFGCADCSNHFQEMVRRHTFSSFNGNDRFSRWLWFAHNQVNLRLAKDPTEDPQYPKRQFPYEEDCPKCRFENGSWNMDQNNETKEELCKERDSTRHIVIASHVITSTLDYHANS